MIVTVQHSKNNSLLWTNVIDIIMQNVFVQIIKCNCINCVIYLYNLHDVFSSEHTDTFPIWKQSTLHGAERRGSISSADAARISQKKQKNPKLKILKYKRKNPEQKQKYHKIAKKKSKREYHKIANKNSKTHNHKVAKTKSKLGYHKEPKKNLNTIVTKTATKKCNKK